ncbi:UDP-N-acetylglucosamine--N-acetylmuramyl-(pentapeptide) pyrophosphoryl-undecaprenol N-acetylglucosamine transferase, partial [Bienertia sinuspersici]
TEIQAVPLCITFVPYPHLFHSVRLPTTKLNVLCSSVFQLMDPKTDMGKSFACGATIFYNSGIAKSRWCRFIE